MIENFENDQYTIVYNGQIYNTAELKETLTEKGFTFSTHSDTEVLLKGFIAYGYDIVSHLNGIFAFAVWDSKKEELFLARDHFGVKPLFYTQVDNHFVFASEIKALFQFPNVEKIVNDQGIGELFGIGPSHTPGTTVFKNIFELKPAHFAIYNQSGFSTKRYWKFISREYTDNFNTTCEKVRFLLQDAISKQLVSDVPLCTFVHGSDPFSPNNAFSPSDK